MMVLSDGRKSFQIDLAVLIQYRRVTDTQLPTQPARHVAVASTRYAIASRLKTEDSGSFSSQPVASAAAAACRYC